ncbi:MAG: hypothetical protein LBN43_05540 [Oscillospiraceae bacterium]|jgi:hypothetical protein|nr:hypothetical protein [Oscillospiraceae bacterium]
MNFNFKFYTNGVREFFYWEDNTSLFNYRYQPIKKDLDFTQSLLDFLDLDMNDYFDICTEISEGLQGLYKDPNASVKSLLFSFDKLSGTHVYFEFLRLQWHEKLNSFAAGTLAGDIREELRYKDITHIPMNINTAQDQIKYMFKNALDTTAIREQAEQYNVTDLYDKTLRSDGNPFEFRQITTGFERIGDSEMVEVLYPADMLDIVDYTLREIIRREIKFKVCKNCGEYFPTIAHGNTEFCNRL